MFLIWFIFLTPSAFGLISNEEHDLGGKSVNHSPALFQETMLSGNQSDLVAVPPESTPSASSPDSSLPSLGNNNTTQPWVGVPPDDILCHLPETHHHPATIELCRSTLAEIRSFPAFSLKQPFEEFVRPRVEHRGKRIYPPFRWAAPDGRCVIILQPLAPGIEDRFSFSDVKRVATEVLEQCESEGECGGKGKVGPSKGWIVDVFGSVPQLYPTFGF